MVQIMKNAIDVDHLTIRFSLANQKVNNLKEYTIRKLKHELTFQEFLALQDVDLHVKPGEAWGLIGTNGSGKTSVLEGAVVALGTFFTAFDSIREVRIAKKDVRLKTYVMGIVEDLIEVNMSMNI